MNQETPPPRHRGSDEQDQGQVQAGDAYIAFVTDQAPSPEAAQLITEIYARHGTPFAVYLSFEDVDRYADDAEAAFQNSYLGSYAERDDLIADTIDAFGWEHDLDRLLGGDPLLRAVVRLDPIEIWNFVGDHYDIVELAGRIYVFEQPP